MNHKILKYYGIEHQLYKKLREELTERLKTIDEIEKEGFTKKNIRHFLEERADVENLDEQISIYLSNKGFHDVEAFVYCERIRKQERTLERIKIELQPS
jgi:hypothetical protein